MGKLLRPSLLSAFLMVFLFSYSQVDTTAPEIKWSVISKKIADKKYELTFTAPEQPNIKFYAPGQNLDSMKSADVLFTDSSVTAEPITTTAGTQTIPTTIFTKGTVDILNGPLVWKVVVNFKDQVPARLLGSLVYFYNLGDAFMADPPFTYSVAMEGGVETGSKIRIASIDRKNPVNNCGDDDTQNKSLFSIFLLGLLGGLIALITPCVFPMIPVTVTFFTKKSLHKKRGITNAVLYGVFIFLIYVAITIPFHIANNTSPEIFNNISTNIWLNLIFFAVFVLFAFSFFGAYEIGLPSSFANKADSKSHLGNIGGVFFMAGTLAIVSFSCTGPILGTLLANVANDGPWPLTAGAAGFGLALGLPFALFAMFPHWLESLPKSGGWMTEVKVILGFIELALAVKFFANADNVEQWGILKREIFIGAWIIIALAIVLYMVGWLKIGHHPGLKRFSFIRIAFITLFTVVIIYLIPGLTNTKYANLRIISGFPPPLSYSIYKHHVLIVKGIKPIQNDYEKALARAKAEAKPLLIDFTGWACQNCRRMEENVWIDKEVDSLMRNEFVVVSLYVDQKTKLPATEQSVYKTISGNEKSIITVGDKWATFETENFGATSQPLYAIISPDEKVLTKTKFYTPSPTAFADWLKCGLEAMHKAQ